MSFRLFVLPFNAADATNALTFFKNSYATMYTLCIYIIEKENKEI